MSLPYVSFIIPMYNHVAHSQAMLASLQASIPKDLTFEIILIDDASTDGTQAWLSTVNLAPIRTLRNERNLGYAKTNNKAASVSSGAVLVLLNNDLLLEPGWLEPMLEVLLDPLLNVGVVGNLQLAAQSGALDHAGVRMTAQGKLEHVRTLATSDVVQKVFAVTAACCLVRKEDFERVDGFDEEFVNGGEDVDLCLKLRKIGKSTYLAQNSLVRHHISLSRSGAILQNEYNSRLLYFKWRRELKTELAEVWRAQIKKLHHIPNDTHIDGVLSPNILETPYATSLLIAENMMLQEEAHWELKLGEGRIQTKSDRSISFASQCVITGLKWSRNHLAYMFQSTTQLKVSGLRRAQNVFFCGRCLPDPNSPDQHQLIELVITVNGIQSKKYNVTPGASINVGIIQPLIFPGLVNTFSIVASVPMLVHHFILDDETIPVE